jgi:hypothetical protein
MGLQETDPVAAAAPESEAAPSHEALSGRGLTYFLVADDSKPAPVWVAKGDVEKHAVG